MKKILVVFTGGTIASSVNGQSIDITETSRYQLLTLYQERFAKASALSFSHSAPVEILSENLHPLVWELLIQALDAIDLEAFSGIVVAHGTDTLAFTAAMLSYYYADIKIPVVLVSSDLPLADPNANGLDNFDAAVALIVERQDAGVFVAYKNHGQTTLIHHAYRLASCLQLSSDFMSVRSHAYLEYNAGNFFPLNQSEPDLALPPKGFSLQAHFSKRILLIRPYPGLDYGQFNLHALDAVLHDVYHSGTACISANWGTQYSVLEFIKRCKDEDIKVYLAPVSGSPTLYSTTQAMLAEGAEILWNISLEAAYVKLLLAYGNFENANLRNAYLMQNNAYASSEFNYS